MDVYDLNIGDVVRIVHEGEPDEFGVVVCVYDDGDFAAISDATSFWALCGRTDWRPTGKHVDVSAIYKALREIREELL